MDIKNQYQIIYYLNIVKLIIKNKIIIKNLKNKYRNKQLNFRSNYN